MPEQAPTLRDMIKEAIDGGLTYEQLSKRAVDKETNHGVSPALLNKIAHRRVDRMPYTYHLRAIAAGLGVPYERVRQAAILEWLPPEAGATDQIPPDRRADLIEKFEELRAAILNEGRPAAPADQTEAGGAA